MRVKYGVCGKERSPSRLDAFVRSLEEERDYYRHEADRYKRARGAGGLDGSPTRTPTRGRSPRARVSSTGYHCDWAATVIIIISTFAKMAI